MSFLRTFLIAAIVTLTSATSFAQEVFEVDGIYYKILNQTQQTVSVDRGTNRAYSGNVVIPATIDYNGKTYRVTALGYGTFANCSDLLTLSIGPNVVSLSQAIFTGCSSLTSISVDPANPFLSSADGVLYADDAKILVKYPAGKNCPDFVIPEGVETIWDFAFEYSFGIERVSFPQSLTTIGVYAFQNTPIESVILPEGFLSLGDFAFYECPMLTVVNTGGLERISDYAFNKCTALTSLTMSPYVTYIGEYAFFTCKQLEEITIPEDVQTIGAGAFKSCESLRTINIPASVNYIGPTAFSFCKSMRSIKVSPENRYYCDLNGVLCNKAATTIVEFPAGYPGEYEVPEGITTIGDRAFYYRTRLTEITFPSTLKVIDNSAFHACSELKEVEIPSSVTTIGSQAFMFCEGLKSVSLGSRVASIGDNAFSMCYELSTIDVYAGVPPTIASENTFSLDTYLSARLNVPSNCDDAYRNAFGWNNFVRISNSLPEAGVEAIGTDAQEAEYFDLQGRKVAEPQSGLYIMRRSGKTSKIIL